MKIFRRTNYGATILPDYHPVVQAYPYQEDMIMPGPTLLLPPGTSDPVDHVLENRSGWVYPGGNQEINVITMQRRPIRIEMTANKAFEPYGQVEGATLPVESMDIQEQTPSEQRKTDWTSFLFGASVGVAGTLVLVTIIGLIMGREDKS